MLDRHVEPPGERAGSHLEETAGIGRDDDGGLASLHVVELSRQETCRHGGLGQVVGTRAATAPVGLGQLDQLDSGDRAKQRPRGRTQALAVRQVAGIVDAGDGETVASFSAALAARGLTIIAAAGRDARAHGRAVGEAILTGG